MEIRIKIGKANMGSHRSEETRKKMSAWQIGRILSAEHIKKLREVHLGIKPSEITRRRMSLAQKRIGNEPPHLTGNKSPNWKGGYENRLMHNRNRRIKKNGNGGSHTLEQWLQMKAYNAYLCADCGNIEPNIKLTEDHITPISLDGSNDISNIQPLCRSCNSRKNNKIIDLTRAMVGSHLI